MLRSMTGFGSAEGQVKGVQYAVEIRSVNSRYFKAVIKLPEGLSSVEADIENLLRQRLNRGTILLTARMRVPDEQAAYRVNTAALGCYIEQLKPLEVDANPILRIDLGSLLQLPGVCEPPPLEEICRQTQKGLMDLVEGALRGLLEMRRREGEGLKTDLLSQCDTIEENLSTVVARAPQVVADYHRRLGERVRELTASAELKIDQETLAREVAVFAERCDVSEEVQRLRGHLEQFRQAAAAGGPVGRKLDFLAQEMLREANTIGSKANDADISRCVVEIKTAVDRIKEQAQNVE